MAALDKRTARALRLGNRAVTLGRAKATITRAGHIPFYVTLSKQAKRAFKRKRLNQIPVHVLITVTDSRGGQFKSTNRKIAVR